MTSPDSTHTDVRGFPGHFLVKPDHVSPGDERIVEGTGDYVVVEKVALR